MTTAAYRENIESFAREPVYLVKLTVTGTLTGSQTFYFSNKESAPINLQIGKDVRPYLLEANGRSVKIQPDKAITERSRISILLADDPDAPDFDSTVFSVYKGNSFFRRLILAQPDFIGSKVEVYRGFIEAGFLESDFELILRGRVEDYEVREDSSFSIIAKDDFFFYDIQQPAEIGDSNLLAGAINSSVLTLTVDDGDQISDPANLDSKDFFPVCLQIDNEILIVSSKSGDSLTIQENGLLYSEDFGNAVWAKSGAFPFTTDYTFGPFGGISTSDMFDFSVVSDHIEQVSVVPAGAGTFTFSIWLKTLGSTGDTATIQIALDDDSQIATNKVSLSTFWRRYEISQTFAAPGAETVKVIVGRDTGDCEFVCLFGAQLDTRATRNFYVATTTNNSGRGAFGTTAASHLDNSIFKEVMPYRLHLSNDGIHPVVILRDLLNRGGVLAINSDQDSFDDQQNFSETIAFRRAGSDLINKPRKLSDHVKEVREQGLADTWIGEDGLVKASLSWRINIPSASSNSINDETNITWLSSSYRGNAESRFTRVFIYFGFLGGGRNGDKPEDYSNVQVVVDLAVEALSGQKAKVIFSKWIYKEADALALAGRIVSRFKRGARLASWTLELKDALALYVGDFIELDSYDVLKETGVSSRTAGRGDSRWQITQKENKHREGTIQIEALEARGKRYCIISPNFDFESGAPVPFPDYPAASPRERQYCFIGDANNLVNAGTEDGYYIL